MTEERAPTPAPLRDRCIVLGVSGSIAAYKAFQVARLLEEAGATVDVALTPNGARFAPPLTFRSLVSGVVTDDVWAVAGESELHVALGRRAHALLVAPASATTIAKLAQGIGDSMVTLTALATAAPLALAPAMDAQMYAHPALQANLATLKARGALIAGPVSGRLASGREGLGRMIEPPEIVGALRALLGRQAGDLRRRHLVISAGGTREAIDPIRDISNRSSGKMGFALAAAARDRGATVTLVTTQPPPPGLFGVMLERVESAAEMQAAVAGRLADADALIMAAAVADYRPAQRAAQKIKKGDEGAGLTLALEETPDILGSLNGSFIRVGFAAETEELLANAARKLEQKRLDLVVANDVSEAAFGAETNRVVLLDRAGGREALPLLHKYDVAQRVLDRVVALLTR